jgi:hypothetical protein
MEREDAEEIYTAAIERIQVQAAEKLRVVMNKNTGNTSYLNIAPLFENDVEEEVFMEDEADQNLAVHLNVTKENEAATYAANLSGLGLMSISACRKGQ